MYVHTFHNSKKLQVLKVSHCLSEAFFMLHECKYLCTKFLCFYYFSLFTICSPLVNPTISKYVFIHVQVKFSIIRSRQLLIRVPFPAATIHHVVFVIFSGQLYWNQFAMYSSYIRLFSGNKR